MANLNLKETAKLIKSITLQASKLQKTLAKRGLIDFIGKFYEFVSLEDIEIYSTEELNSIAIGVFKFLEDRNGGAVKIRIFNPEKTRDGWESEHTVIEIIGADMPFLVDSVTEEIYKHGLKIFTLAHPVISVERNDKGQLKSINSSLDIGNTESVMHFQITHIPDDKAMAVLKSDILQVLKSVNLAVTDWKSLLKKINYTITELSATSSILEYTSKGNSKKRVKENAEEIKEFLEWLKDNNFVFLGYVEYDFTLKKGQGGFVKGSQLGILKLSEPEIIPKISFDKTVNPLAGTEQILLDITKANRKSSVHRLAHMDYIGIKRVNEEGEVVGEHRFLGLFTSMVYYQSARNIPIIRKKIRSIQKKSGFSSSGHSAKSLAAILEDFPRDELFQTSEGKLFEAALDIVVLAIKPKVSVFVREDDLGRFMSCIIFVPRERMNTDLRVKMEQILAEAFNGTVINHFTQVTESHLARLQVIVKTHPGKIPSYNIKNIEKQLAAAARKWTEDLKHELEKRFGEKQGQKIYNDYNDSFSLSYRNRFSVEDAYYDILQIEKVIHSEQISFDIYESAEGTDEIFEFKVYNPREQIALSEIMPIMENMGLKTLDEHTYVARKTPTGVDVCIHRFRFVISGVKKPRLREIKGNFEEAFEKTWLGCIQNDALNKLILLSRLKWRDVTLLRAYSKYLQQSGFFYSQAFVNDSLAKNPELVKLLVQLFYTRFAPFFSGERDKEFRELIKKIDGILAKVSNLAEDRVVRGFVELISATLRTNYFQTNEKAQLKEYISFKFSSKDISWLPEPKPYAEIFVYSSKVEGVHLRGGKVARGGLRWSDRVEDFRTEVLGLMKAQMTKNSVIIPVGSKGGFIVKNPPTEGGREAFLAEGIECYKTFLRGLLDVTDNIVGGKIKHPADVVRLDGDDPYLVVAADKGTATFSDIANLVAKEYDFWIGDAFASGGSVGYDHKKMGITARGAWISVKRHFHEMGLDVDKDDFTVVGIGDMAGDVFGNGMLCSKHIKLVGAFNHLHIFIDPDPNPKISYKERARLFKLPRSSWTDYKSDLISKGGGVFKRDAKSIKITGEIKDLFGIEDSRITPDELIKYMLTAEIDLLWNGGIGTYIKSKAESNDAVGDKANDNLRVNGNDVAFKVIGEGGNLGLTQLGRIECAKNAVRLNSDSIDNSAGVDCSDHEVNIKIVLDKAVVSGDLTTTNRNKLLESMTDDVAKLVLRDNELQTQAITIAQLQGHTLLEFQGKLMDDLERRGYLDREIEFLPSAEEISRRHIASEGLTRPEISVLLAYSKIVLYEDLLKSNVPDAPYYKEDLLRYFPKKIQDKYRKQIEQHPLRREIIATSVTNSIINRVGSSLFHHLKEDTGLGICDIARAYTITRDVFDLRYFWDEISQIEQIDVTSCNELYMEVQNIVERASLWFLRQHSQPLKVDKVVKDFAPGVKSLYGCLEKILPTALKKVFNLRLNRYIDAGVKEPLARKLAGLEAMSSACDIVEVAAKADLKVNVVGKVYFELGARLNLSWMRRSLLRLGNHSYWQRISNKTLIDEIYDQQRRLTSEVIKHLCKDSECSNSTTVWIEENENQIARYDEFIKDLKAHEAIDFSMLIVAIRKIKEICAN